MDPDVDDVLDPEDILSSSLQTLYDYQPITLSSAGSLFCYTWSPSPEDVQSPRDPVDADPITIALRTPDTHASNWSLHASSIWASSRFLADHLYELQLTEHLDAHKAAGESFRILELGAGAGLPGILLAKLHPEILVTVSDYPDDSLIQTLSENITRNEVSGNCIARAYAWGSDPAVLIPEQAEFDMVVAADTLWNSENHSVFIDTLKMVLKRSTDARVHLIAGLHTGRYTLQAFLDAVRKGGFEVESTWERETNGSGRRAWDVSREEDDKERRKWVVWITLKWL